MLFTIFKKLESIITRPAGIDVDYIIIGNRLIKFGITIKRFIIHFIICVHFVIIYVHFAIIRFHLVIIYVHFVIFRVVGIIFRVFRVRDIIFAYCYFIISD
ncbi:hypothetical protein RhiirB3_232563 [Rhizophagus irregularis]|nr:hypothetical protein RhiirB3_232563 [Rhizophagus irregularis]